MATSYDQALSYVISYFSSHFHMPESSFSKDTSLRDDLLYSDESLVPVAQYINQAHWTDKYVYPKDIAGCETIGDIAKLVSDGDA